MKVGKPKKYTKPWQAALCIFILVGLAVELFNPVAAGLIALAAGAVAYVIQKRRLERLKV